MMAGDLQAELVGARRQDELPQGRDLRLPAEPPDPAVLHPADAPPGRDGLPGGRLDEDLVGQRTDHPRAEQGRGLRREMLTLVPKRSAAEPAGMRAFRSDRHRSYRGSTPERWNTALVAWRKPGWTFISAVVGPDGEQLTPDLALVAGGHPPAPVPIGPDAEQLATQLGPAGGEHQPIGGHSNLHGFGRAADPAVDSDGTYREGPKFIRIAMVSGWRPIVATFIERISTFLSSGPPPPGAAWPWQARHDVSL